jgi:hypothetical protein
VLAHEEGGVDDRARLGALGEVAPAGRGELLGGGQQVQGAVARQPVGLAGHAHGQVGLAGGDVRLPGVGEHAGGVLGLGEGIHPLQEGGDDERDPGVGAAQAGGVDAPQHLGESFDLAELLLACPRSR